MEFSSVACPFCSLHCDDLHLQFDGGHWKLISPPCSLASRCYGEIDSQVEGGEEEALLRAMHIQQNARSPMILLGGDADQDTVLASLRLAQRYSAYFLRDNEGSDVFANAVRITGLLTSSIFEFRNHADQIVILGEDPAKTHPRFWEFVGDKKKESALWLGTSGYMETIRKLRLVNQKNNFYSLNKELETVAQRISKAGSGTLFINDELIASDVDLLTEIFLWLRDLNVNKKWFCQVISPSANPDGVSHILRGQTGFPDNIRFINGRAHHDARLLRFSSIIENRETDVILTVNSHLFNGEKKKLKQVKVIAISPQKPHFPSDVWLPCAQVGLDAPGVMFRLDGVPVHFSSLVDRRIPPASDYLDRLLERIAA